MKKFCLLLAAAFVGCGQVWAGTFTTVNTLIPVPASANGTDTGDTSPSTTDTIHLDATVFVPDGVTAPAPVVIIIHGFGASKSSGTVTAVAQDFASQGYVVVTPSTRGFGDSDGLVMIAGPNEINDLKTIILNMQSGSIGDSPAVPIPVNATSKFGVTGASYGGGHSFEIMRTHVAGLAAVAPVIGWTDLYQSLSPNDVPKLSFGLALFGGGYDTAHPNYDDRMFEWASDIFGGHPEDMRTGGPKDNIDWRSVVFNPAELTVPCFVIQGWHDWLFPAEQATALFGSTTGIPFFKMYVGGIGHPPGTSDVTVPEALYLRTQLVRWFDYWLKGIDTGITTEPRVTIGPERTDLWSQAGLVQADTYPLPGTFTQTYYFNGSTLNTTGPKGKSQIVKPTSLLPSVLQPLLSAAGSDASTLIAAIISVGNSINGTNIIYEINTGADSGANSLRFITKKKLTSNVHVVGTPQFHFYVSATSAGATYFAQVLERSANGSEHIVSRGAFKDHSSSFATAHQIDFSGEAMNHVFDAGNKIEVKVSTRDYPFFLPNPDEPTIKIYRNAEGPSRVDLPIAP